MLVIKDGKAINLDRVISFRKEHDRRIRFLYGMDDFYSEFVFDDGKLRNLAFERIVLEYEEGKKVCEL